VTTDLAFDSIEEARRHWSRFWPDSGRAMAAATSIMRAEQIITKSMDAALRPFDLTWARFEALVLLSFARTGMLPMGKMGERLMIHPTSVTSIINRLEDDGFVVRLAHPSDRRTRLAQITDAGRELAAQASVAVDKSLFGLGLISEDTQDHLIELVRELRIAVGDITATSEEGQVATRAG
jgi:DNA-binding MarR family transcriptional regulator